MDAQNWGGDEDGSMEGGGGWNWACWTEENGGKVRDRCRGVESALCVGELGEVGVCPLEKVRREVFGGGWN